MDSSRSDTPAAPEAISPGEALRFWWKLGWISFGGPAGQIAIMHEELVTRRRWISEKRFLHALNYCMVLPGPEAQQLATYIGWLLHGTRGGIAAGALFVLPSLFVLIALSWLYMAFGQQPLFAAALWGLKPAVVAIVLAAAWRIGRRALTSPSLWALAALSFTSAAILHIPFPAIVLGAGLAGFAGGRWWPRQFQGGAHRASASALHAPALIDDETPTPPHARASRAGFVRHLLGGLLALVLALGALFLLPGHGGPLLDIALFFSKAALLTFGGAYAVLPYVTQAAVSHYGWLTTRQMMDGLALGETTPGPLIIIVAFVGFLAAWPMAPAWAVAGACVATFFTFLPSFVFILVGGPLVEATHDELRLSAPLTAITAAVVGVILGLALSFGTHVAWPAGPFTGAVDWPALTLAAAALFALVKLETGIIRLIAVCAAAGLALRWLPGLA
ncbi:MAG TPA: chromate efflux transporter [Moraxellaceae bacterium]|nr:chromate efflux transporter [Moraxellaceae bacterium]